MENNMPKEFLELAVKSFNPDNFCDLLKIFRLQYPNEIDQWMKEFNIVPEGEEKTN